MNDRSDVVNPGLLSHLEQVEIPESMCYSSPFEFSPHPSKLFAGSLALLNLGDANLPDTICVASVPQGLDTTSGLLKILVASISSKSMTVTAIPRWLSALLDQKQRFWSFLMSISGRFSHAENLLSHLVERVFQTLQDLVLYLAQPQWQSSVRPRVHSLWAQCIVDMIHISQASSFKIMTQDIISALGLTTAISSRAPGLAFSVCEILQPTDRKSVV